MYAWHARMGNQLIAVDVSITQHKLGISDKKTRMSSSEQDASEEEEEQQREQRAKKLEWSRCTAIHRRGGPWRIIDDPRLLCLHAHFGNVFETYTIESETTISNDLGFSSGKTRTSSRTSFMNTDYEPVDEFRVRSCGYLLSGERRKTFISLIACNCCDVDYLCNKAVGIIVRHCRDEKFTSWPLLVCRLRKVDAFDGALMDVVEAGIIGRASEGHFHECRMYM